MNEVFISWSGKKAKKYADFLNKIFNEVFGKNAKAFYSENIENGKQWLKEINLALKESCIGIFILTRESIKRPWLNFEAGAIFKADENKLIIPIYVDISLEELREHPLRYFQSSYRYNWEDIERLLSCLHERLGWGYETINTAKIEEKINKFIDDNNSGDGVESLLFKEGIQLYESGSVVAEISEEKFWGVRQSVIENANGQLILAGQSLEDAFGEKGIVSIVDNLKRKIINKEINEIKILISNPSLFSEIHNFDEFSYSPLSRVSLTMGTLIHDIFPIAEEQKCVVEVYFLPLLELDHAVITNRYMIFRSTKIWTRNGNYKGAFMLYRKTKTPNGEYDAHRRYLMKLMENSAKIDLEVDGVDSPSDSKTMKNHKAWRNEIKQREYKMIRLYKLYRTQIVNYVAADWRNEEIFQNVFKGSKDIILRENLFDASNLLDDDTQKVLLPYIKETELLFEKVIKKYDSSVVNIGTREIQRSGVKIFPSLDLGFPNNIQRLAGGFVTGMLVMWKCGTPIVPVDATVNVCSSSVFEIKGFDVSMKNSEFRKYIEKIIFKATKEEGYSFSFDSGNHFLMIAQDIRSRKIYLVLHSSANEFKNSYMGLYPVENNWYSNSIRTYPSPTIEGRYIRYIKDTDARYFIDNAHKLEKYNVQIHRWFANEIGKEECKGKRETFHHYYMPTDDSIAIGTYVEEPNTVVPIFSDVGKDIFMFKISKDNWTIRLGGKDVCLIPHGWGQVIDGIHRIEVNGAEKSISIDGKKYTVNSKERLQCDVKKHIRHFQDEHQFLEYGKKMLKGEIVQTLRPLYLYCSKKKGKINDAI